MSIRERLLANVRAYKPFDFDNDGETLKLYARRCGVIEMAEIEKARDHAYEEARAAYQASDSHTTSLYATLSRQTPAKLAEYIADAEKPDLQNEASSLNDDKPFTDEVVKNTFKTLRDERIADLKTRPMDELLDMALQRGWHYSALGSAITAANRALIRAIVYEDETDSSGAPTGNKVPLFPDEASLTEMPGIILDGLLTESIKTLTPPATPKADEPPAETAGPAADETPLESAAGQ